MRKIVLLCLSLFLSSLWFACFKKDTGCSYKPDNTVAPLSEQQALKKYLDSIGVIASSSTNGFYYQIVTEGAGAPPGVCSRVMVTYTGQLTNGSVFDQQTDALFTLGGLISGWKQGLPLISKGGEIKLYLPPS
ncbi:MAG: FKBP-type peptidyl-prolyl cis-trans isomerase, partial [Bacteroidetes bacterium]|nr:FKBP-type peptidyl-prolyl cis-trans isomerase [Bacteroidota bacterium]